MTKISIDNAQKVDITAKRKDNFNLDINITNSDGTAVEFASNFEEDGEFDVLVFSITNNDFDPILIASNVTLNINSSLSSYIDLHLHNAQAVAASLSRYAGNNVDRESSNYGTLSANNTPEFLNSIFYNNPDGVVNSYAAVGTIFKLRGEPSKVVFNNDDFDMPPGSYKYTFRSLRFRQTSSLSTSKFFRDSKTWLYGKIKINE